MNNFSSWEISPLSDAPIPNIDLLRHLVGWGILAPNAHNIQPWKFILNSQKNSIDICIDPCRTLPSSDACGRQAVISLGCAAVNILLAAHYYGLNCELKISEETKLRLYPEPIVEMIFSGQSKINAGFLPSLLAMKNRRVNRSKYDHSKEVPTEFVEIMSKTSNSRAVTLFCLRDVLTKIAISEIQFNADQFVMFSKGFRKELGSCILPNDTDRCVGMPGSTLGLGDETTKRIIEELKKETPNDPDLLSGNSYVSRDVIRNSPLVCVIAGRDDLPSSWIRAGLAFGQIAVEAEIKKLNIAVHAAMVEVGFLNKLLKLRLFTSLTPLVVFRLGYATEERPHSPRLALEYVTEIIG